MDFFLEKLAARAATTTIVRDILAIVFLMDKSQGPSRGRSIKIKENLLKVLLNLVKSSRYKRFCADLYFLIHLRPYRGWPSSIFGSQWFLSFA